MKSTFTDTGTMDRGTLYLLSAFTTSPDGGNPAGVWVGDRLPDETEMQRVAREVGFSETAFVAPRYGARRTVRYFSPQVEIPFCGHATIAAGVQLSELNGAGTYDFDTASGRVVVDVRLTDGVPEAALTSVVPRHVPAPPDLLARALTALRWQPDDVDTSIPAVLAFAGIWHLVIAARTEDRLAKLDYDFDALAALTRDADLTTVHLVWRESATVFHARDPFPVGGVVEDPATGAAAAAFGGYLRDAGLIQAPATITILQGEAMGRPSRLNVEIPATGGIIVSGNAVRLAPID